MKQNFLEKPDKFFAYWLGFLWADGWVQGNHIYFHFLKDDYINIKNIFDHVANFETKFVMLPERREQSWVKLKNRILVDFLKSKDYQSKTDSPDKIIQWLPENLRNYWFLGYFDGDGSFYLNDKYSLCQVAVSGPHTQQWNFMENLCTKLQIQGNQIKRPITNKGHKYSQYTIGSKKNFLKFGSYIYPNNYEFGLKRKYEKYEKFLKNGWDKSQFPNSRSFIQTKAIVQTTNAM